MAAVSPDLAALRSALVEGRGGALVVEPHPKRQSPVGEERLDLVERLAAKASLYSEMQEELKRYSDRIRAEGRVPLQV